MKIRTKLLTGYLAIIILVVLIGGVALSMNYNTGDQLEEIDNKYWQGSKAVMDLRTNIYAMQGHAMCYVNEEPEAIEEIEEFKEEISENLLDMEESGLFDVTTLNTIDDSVDEFYDTISEVCAVVDTGIDADIDVTVEEMDEQAEEFKEYLEGIEEDAKSEMDMQILDLDDSLAFANTLILITMAIVLGFGLVFSFSASKSISSPIIMMTKAADEVSSGKKDVEFLNIEGDDEIGTLAKSFNRMINSVMLAIETLEGKEE